LLTMPMKLIVKLTEFGSTGRHYLVFKDQGTRRLLSGASKKALVTNRTFQYTNLSLDVKNFFLFF
jgi:hypothetical protein